MNISTVTALLLLLSSMQGYSGIEQQYILRQRHDDSCGFASAAALLQCYWDIPADETELISRFLGSPQQHSRAISLQAISDLLAHYGVQSAGYRLDSQVLAGIVREYGPLLCWDDRDSGHFFLLIHAFSHEGKEVFVIADPSEGVSMLSKQQLLSRWSSLALLTASRERSISLGYQEELTRRYLEYLKIHQALRRAAP